jgi:hypothetical protein
MPEVRRFSLAKPTQQTKFKIDFEWWQQNDRDWHVYLSGLLCPEHQKAFADAVPGQMVDFVDPLTAEIQKVDGIQNVLITHCARQSGFITEFTSMVDSVFRIFLANGNTPLTPSELSAQLGRPAETILRTLTGGRVYKGVRPCQDC